MVVCQCGNRIEHLVVIADPPYTAANRQSRPLVISNGLHFACENCATNIISGWEKHNKSRVDKYLIRSVDINVSADTKKEFAERALPQIISHFKAMPPGNWYIPNRDIKNALKILKKSQL